MDKTMTTVVIWLRGEYTNDTGRDVLLVNDVWDMEVVMTDEGSVATRTERYNPEGLLIRKGVTHEMIVCGGLVKGGIESVRCRAIAREEGHKSKGDGYPLKVYWEASTLWQEVS